MRRLAAFLAALLLPAALCAQTASRDCVDGENDYISLSVTSEISFDEGAFGIWAAMDPMSTDGYAVSIYRDTTNSVSFIWVNSTNNVQWFHEGGNVTDTHAVVGAEDGVWHHYAMAWSLSGNLITYYRDGAVAGTDTGLAAASAGASFSRLCNSAINVTVDFDGRLASFELWNRPITAVEVQQSMRCPGSVASGLIRYLPLWEAGNTYVDLSSVGTDATNTGTASSSAGPPIAQCAGGVT